jgi:hypothetical protein
VYQKAYQTAYKDVQSQQAYCRSKPMKSLQVGARKLAISTRPDRSSSAHNPLFFDILICQEVIFVNGKDDKSHSR